MKKSKFAERLVKLRNDRGLTQHQFADTCGINRSSVGGYEASGKEPPYDVLIQIAEFYGCTVDYLLGVSDNRYPVHSAVLNDNIGFAAKFDAMTDMESKTLALQTINDARTMFFPELCAPDPERLKRWSAIVRALDGCRSSTLESVTSASYLRNNAVDAQLYATLTIATTKCKNAIAQNLDELMIMDLLWAIRSKSK